MLQQALLASLQSVGTVLLIVATGNFLCRKGILAGQARSTLAAIVTRVGYPALLFTRLLDCPQCRVDLGSACPPCTNLLSEITESWLVVLAPLLVDGAGLLLGSLAAAVSGCPDSFRAVCKAAVALPNHLGIPVVVLDMLGGELRRRGVLRTDPIRQLSVSTIAAEPLMWMLGAYLLEMEKEPESEESSSEEGERTLLQRFRAAARELLKLLVGLPPLWGLAAALAVALLQPWLPLQSLLVDETQQDQAPLKFAFKALVRCGQLVVPLSLLLLGSNLKAADYEAAPLPACLTVAAAKLMGVPTFMSALVFAMARVLPPQRKEIWLVALVVSCSPTATSTVAIAQQGKGAEALSTAMAVQYYVVPLTVTLWLTLFSVLLQSDWYLLD